MSIVLEPVATVLGGRADPTDDDWDKERAVIQLDETRFTAEAIAGLDSFSHIEVVFHFDRVPEDKVQFGARHPRGNTDWPKLGIFAQRGKNRPNRTTATGDVCNKIGTYLKALAAHDNGVPFYVGLPSPTIDWTLADGVAEIPIEQRSGEEVSAMTGRTEDGRIETVTITPDGSAVANYAFDVTLARLVSGLITERGIAEPSRDGLLALFPDRRP